MAIGNSSPLALFGDFGFVGGEDTAPNPLQDNQTCINWYAEVNKQNAKEVVGLLACPGLVELVFPAGGGVAAATAPPAAPLQSTLLMHFDGVNGSTTFTDVYGSSWSVGAGTPTISTTQSKFGGASLNLPTSSYISTTNVTDLNFGTAAFTVDFWLYPTSISANGTYGISASGNGLIIFNNGSNIGVIGNNSILGTGSAGPSLNVWSHLAYTRTSGTGRLFLNGTLIGTWTDNSNYGANSTTIGDTLNRYVGFIDEMHVVKGTAVWIANFTPPTAAYTDAPTPLVITKLWENDSTTFPLYNGSTGAYVGIPTAVGSGVVRVYDRGGLTTPGTLGGDGNTYLLNAVTGAVLAPTTPNSFESPIQTNDYNATVKFRDAPSGLSAGLVMPHAAATFGVYANSFGVSQQNIPNPPMSTTGPKLWTEDYLTGTLHTDVMAALSVPPLTGNWKGIACIPCADFTHFGVITADTGTGNAWFHLLSITSGQAATEVARYQFSAINSVSSFDAVHGFFNKNGMTSLGSWSVAMLESNLTSLWLLDQGTQNVVHLYTIAGGAVQVPPQNVTAFNTIPGNFAGIVANNGNAMVTDFTRYSLFSTGSTAPAVVKWPTAPTILNLPVRGLWELPNDNTALCVIGNTCYLVTLATPANPFSFATLALTSVGTLQTTIGPVHIRDNDIGGYAVIVDGPYGYLYNISTQAFSQITDPAFLGADTVAFIDGWWIFNQPGTQTFYTQAQQYGITFNASNFALKDSSADNLRAVFENKEQLWLVGDKTTEVWYDAGGQYFAFQRLVGTPMQFGTKAAHSLARFSSEGQDGIILFGRSERGENVIIKTRGFSFDVVSTPAFSKEVAQYPITSDAIAYTYQEDTHEFYILTFPTADVTWCYDAQSGLLHKRLSYDPYLQKFHRHRSNCFMNFQGMRIVGDYQFGSLFQLTRTVQTDAGWPLRAIRRSPHVWDKGQRGRVFMASLQADFRPGVGNSSGLGSNPQAYLRISRDGGATTGQTWPAPIGQTGQYKTRTMWRKLAFGRDNVLELEVIDPVPRDLIGVTLRAFSS